MSRSPPRRRKKSSSPPSGRGARELADVEHVFGALAHPSRRQILLVIHFRGGQMTAGEIADRFACTWPTTTRHLHVLKEAGLVRVEPRGRERIYSIDAGRLRGVVGDWIAWFDGERGPPPHRQGEPR